MKNKDLLLIIVFATSLCFADDHAKLDDHPAPAAHAGEAHGADDKKHGQTPDHSEKIQVLKSYQITDVGADIRVPKKVWSLIEADGKPKGPESLTFATLKLRLTEKNPGVLTDKDFLIELPRGGAEVDLAQFVKDQAGTFFLRFDLSDFGELKDMKVFFISRSRKRKLDGEIWGAGCRRLLDVTKFILGTGVEKGIELNTTRHRHLSVLGGSFIFSMGNQIAQVTLKDSTQPHLFCGAEAKAE